MYSLLKKAFSNSIPHYWSSESKDTNERSFDSILLVSRRSSSLSPRSFGTIANETEAFLRSLVHTLSLKASLFR